MKPLGVGVVGCGHACRDLHRPPLLKHPEWWEVRALYDMNRPAAESEAREFGEPAEVVDTLEALLEREDIELVLVLTKPPTTHYEVTVPCLRAGKHVFVEKPMAQTTQECDEMIQAAEEAGVVLSVHHNRRWDDNFVETKQVIDSGQVGEPQFIRITIGSHCEPCSNWDWGVHLVDQALLLGGGNLVQLSGWAHYPQEDNDHQGYGLMRLDFERRPMVEVDFLPHSHGREPGGLPRFYVAGSTDFFIRPAGEQGPYEEPIYEELYRCLREGGPNPVDAREARNAIYALELMGESVRQGRPLPADNWLPVE